MPHAVICYHGMQVTGQLPCQLGHLVKILYRLLHAWYIQ